MKKAELTTEQIVIIILLIAAFAIILYIYWQFNWKGMLNKETCHNSVILKASSPTFQGRKILDVPLRCQTEKICITTSSNGKCSDFGEDKDVRKEVIKSEEDVRKVIDQALYDCWWEMGEGKVDIFSREFSGKGYTVRCVECSTIAFDDKIKNNSNYKDKGISGLYKSLYEKIPGSSIRYVDFLAGGVVKTPYNDNYKSLDYISVQQPYSIMFVEYDRTTAPEDLMAIGGAVASLIVPAIFTEGSSLKSIEADALLLITGGWAGGKLGGFIGNKLIGEEFIATWMILPSVVGEKEVELRKLDRSSFKDFKADKDNEEYCYAKQSNTNYYYALKKGDSKLYVRTGVADDKGNFNWQGGWEDKKIEGSDAEWLRTIASELYILCNDLSSVQCRWESTV